MSFFVPKKPQPQPDNKCPDCLSMELAGIPVRPEISDDLELFPKVEQPQIDLYLTINFNDRWESLNQGRIKFGLKGGQLRLKLEGAEIPDESPHLTGSLELRLANTYENSRGESSGVSLPSQMIQHNSPLLPQSHNSGKETGNRGKGRSFASIILNPKSHLDPTQERDASGQLHQRPSLSHQAKDSLEKLPNKTHPFQGNICHITKKVSEANPTWIFAEEKGQPVLKGQLHQVKLATLNVTGSKCRVQATFEVSGRDICLTDAEGLWPSDISRNKRAILDRLIIQQVLQPKFEPYLSRVRLHYE